MLEAHPDNAKALFRRGVANIHRNKTEQAEWDLTRVQEINPGGNIYNSPWTICTLHNHLTGTIKVAIAIYINKCNTLYSMLQYNNYTYMQMVM